MVVFLVLIGIESIILCITVYIMFAILIFALNDLIDNSSIRIKII